MCITERIRFRERRMKIIIEVDDVLSKENIKLYSDCLNCEDEFILAVRFEK